MAVDPQVSRDEQVDHCMSGDTVRWEGKIAIRPRKGSESRVCTLQSADLPDQRNIG